MSSSFDFFSIFATVANWLIALTFLLAGIVAVCKVRGLGAALILGGAGFHVATYTVAHVTNALGIASDGSNWIWFWTGAHFLAFLLIAGGVLRLVAQVSGMRRRLQTLEAVVEETPRAAQNKIT